MNKKRDVRRSVRRAAVWILLGVFWAGMCPASPRRSGEAVAAATVGKVQTRVFVGPVHEGRTELRGLSEGQSIGESSRVICGKNGRACMVLSPGAILCVAPETELTFRQLRHTADGLPKSEEDIIRRIHVDLHKGRILLRAGKPAPTLDIRVRTDAGEIESSGGTFTAAQTGQGEWAVISEEYGTFVTPAQASRSEVPEGQAIRMTLQSDGTATIEKDDRLLDSPLRTFEVCNAYFDDLETFISETGRLDRPGLSRYIGETEGIFFIGETDTVLDVSPSVRQVARDLRASPPVPGAEGTRQRWDTERIHRWYENLGVVKGVNYVPRYAVNSVEMWSEEAFDPEVIGEELDWAREAGYTTLRVQFQYTVWREDPKGFLDRVDEFLTLADRRTLKIVPVLFDDRNLAMAEPVPGPQQEPVPGQHNARWVPSPGPAAVMDRRVWPDLESYVKAVVDRFKRDDRIVYWDLYNRAGDNGLWEQSLPLMDQVFNWAREIDPEQPLAVPAWTLVGNAMTARKLERSDLITFQSFDSAQEVEALLTLLQRYDRPIICSDWLMRQKSNTFEEILPLFSTYRVGWFNRGLVNGKVQEWIQQDLHRYETNPEIWQHDVLKKNGEAYNGNEIRLIQAFRFQDRF